MLRGTTVESYHEGACVHRGDGSLDYILHPEGVVRATGQGLSHEYFLRDHLGNTRVVFDATGAVVQRTDYYPFGMTAGTAYSNGSDNRYLYNGKELQAELDLGWYDYGWRMYDPTLGRWNCIDNLAEKYYPLSPYVYCANNPVTLFDVDGNFFTGAFEKWKKKIDNFFNGKIVAKQNQIARREVRRIKAENKGNTERTGRIEKRIQRNEEQLVNIKNDYDAVQREIATMEESNQEYRIVEENGLKTNTATGTDEKGITYLASDGAIEIAIDPNGSLGIFAHELKHGYQFEIGAASFGYRETIGKEFIYDKQDEVEAYQRQGMFGSTRRTLPSNYDGLPSGPISIHTIKNPALIIAINLKNTTGLQSAANYYNQAFRVNGATYIPKKQ